MNLLVIVTLLISVIAIYAQVIGVQTAQMFSHQTGVAQAMLTWHTAAVSMAANIIDTGAYTNNTCSLTASLLPGLPAGTAACPSPKNGAGAIDTNGTITDTNGNPNLIYNKISATNQCVHLPATCNGVASCTSCTAVYDTKSHQFYSVMFQSGGQTYVATIVPAATGQTYITLAPTSTNPTPQIALTMTELMQQLKHTATATTAYGYVNAANQVNSITLPTFTNSNGAIAIVTSPKGF